MVTDADVAVGVGVETVPGKTTPVEAAEAATVEAAEAARVKAEAAEAARAETEAAEAARVETEAAETARVEAEAVEAARQETTAAEAARRETKAVQTARAETEAAEAAARAETEVAEAVARAETEAAVAAERVEAEKVARETAARAEAEAAPEEEGTAAEAAEGTAAEADEFPPPLLNAEKVRALLYNAQSRAARSRRESWSSCGATYFAHRAYIAANLARLQCALTTASESEFSTRASEHTEEASAFGTAAAEARTAAQLAGHRHTSCPSLDGSLRGMMATGGVLPYTFTASHLLPVPDSAPVVARGARMHAEVMAVGCASGAVLLLLCLPFRAPVLLQTLSAHLRRVTGA